MTRLRVVELGRLALVDADAAVVGGRVKQHVARMLEQAAQAGVERDQVIVALAGHEDARPVAFEPLDHVLAQEAGPAGDRDAFAGPEALHAVLVVVK